MPDEASTAEVSALVSQTPEEQIQEVYELAAKLLNERTPREKVEAQLIERGLDRESVGIVLTNLFEARASALKQAGIKSMVYGALWCIGGIILTAVTSGQFIFYGAVLVGAYQLIRGVFHYAKGSMGGRW
ncbi:MAG: hypothetical protein ACT4PY_12730 [Armatimonadota bacterium]